MKLNGVRVGRVERPGSIPTGSAAPWSPASLQAKTPVKENTRAILNIQGITGLEFDAGAGAAARRTRPPCPRAPPSRQGESLVGKLTGQARAAGASRPKMVHRPGSTELAGPGQPGPDQGRTGAGRQRLLVTDRACCGAATTRPG
ncbi:MAG: hypothetical protein MZV63_37425 [Marinilabiliales bacterium]|nr:hypothetical protein [Marinilabiliales bacterium]